MGGASGSDTQTIKTEPWSKAQPYLESAMSIAGNLAQTPVPNYPYQRSSPMNALQQNALASKANYGINAAAPMIANTQSAWSRALNADDVANNPLVQGQLQVNQNLLNRNLQENILPSLGDQAIRAGGYGGSGQGVAEGIAARGTQEALANQNATTMLQAYGQGLGAQSNAMGQSQNQLGLGFIPSATGMEVGQTMRAEDQKLMDEAYQRFMHPYEGPWTRLNRAMGVIQPAAGLGSQQTSPNPNQSNPLAGALGGAAVGYDLLPALMGSMTGPTGALVGGGLGLLSSLVN